MKEITIVFETDLSADELHEALCQAIHEVDPVQLDKLTGGVYNIIHPKHQKGGK